MDLTPYLETLRADLAAAAAPGGPETTRAAELLGHSLEASARLALLEALSDAAAEITTHLSDATVEVRLRGREADLVVTRTAPEQPDNQPPPPPMADAGDLTRLTLRMAESLKTHVEQMAAAEGISVNAWLVRAVTSALTFRNQPQPPRSGKRMTGYFQA
ncbi:hypothetical protein [Paractinoplanes toevensis]|uniref:Toxin-antitoxin system HicB family antitoxin n=1 Tax=Paractinoplanes toevensis TaxID=571911 RepID=A0A919TH27_9ACTN|nr:hypothetical protein [Actinoplanes toevensis]GIM95212.1 hypothetical protein Ato02nite_070050 [Actinoplanes toevensis]